MAVPNHITEIVQDVLAQFAEKSQYTLADSRHAPKNARNAQAASKKTPSVPEHLRLGAGGRIHSPATRHKALSTKTGSAPFSKKQHRLSGKRNSPKSRTATEKSNMAPPANIDDTAGFMAAVRSRRQGAAGGEPASIPASAAEVKQPDTTPPAPVFASPDTPTKHNKENVNVTPSKSSVVTPNKQEKQRESATPTPGLEASMWADPELTSPTHSPVVSRGRKHGWKSVLPQPRVVEAVGPTKKPAVVGTAVATESILPQPDVTEAVEPPKEPVVVQPEVATQPAASEDREHLTHFKSWGTPMTRDKPASQVRRIILTNLPSTFNAPAKVLTIVHGGAIESINLSASGSAHVLFCDAAACKAYYDKYPNGIAVGPGGRQTIFVDMGKEVDVVSSQLTLSLSTGATRVIRCAGADMKVHMNQLYQMASAGNRKVEKILDTYIPGESRIVTFRFCSIEDAVRFRAAIVRDEDWEHCNVQYWDDPCEIATSYHVD